MKTLKKKNQKPIDFDVNLKYRCPNPDCSYDHWLSLKETQTKHFKVVCDCGTVFRPKQIARIKIIYTEPAKIEVIQTEEKKFVKPPVALVDSCVKLLVSYGFTKQESLELIDKEYNKNNISTPSLLVKHILQNLGELDDSDQQTNKI